MLSTIQRIAVLIAGLWLAGVAVAAPPVRLIMPFAAGGSADAVARIMARHLDKELGAPVIVENQAGANGMIGTAAAARALPDGRTLLITSEAYATVNPLLYKSTLGYDPDSLTPLTIIGVQSAVLAVRADGPIQNLSDFVEQARRKGLSYSSAGVGSTSHLASQYLAFMLGGGLTLMHVPYKGGAPAIQAVLSGEVDAGFIVTGNVMPYVKSGKLRALAIASGQRLPQLADVPTIEEIEKWPFVVDNAVVVLVQARTPDEIKRRLADGIRKAVDSPDMKEYLESNGYFPMNSGSDAAARWLAREKARWTELIVNQKILGE